MMPFFSVDDIVVVYNVRFPDKVDNFQAKLFVKYEMKFLGEMEWFLGVQITRDRHHPQLWLSQESYIEKLTAKLNISADRKSPETPPPHEELSKHQGQVSPQEIHAYQQRIRSITFTAVITL